MHGRWVFSDQMMRLCQRMVRRIIEDQHLCGFTDGELEDVILQAKELLTQEPALLHLTAPFVVFGDLHGQLNDFIRFLMVVGMPPNTRLLFLGDYVDRCKKSLEVIMLVICLKILHPEDVFILRGNHETWKINRIYGFYRELAMKRDISLWNRFNEMFNEIPLSAVISKRILCMHGGISPSAMNWQQFLALKKPKTQKDCENGVVLDLLWSDPSHNDPCCGGFKFNTNRGCSVQFDATSVKKICRALNVDFICRAHEITSSGHTWAFDHRLLTIFSAPNYCGIDGNSASVMHVSRNLEIFFTTLRPAINKNQLTETQQKLLKKQESTTVKTPLPTKQSCKVCFSICF